MNTKQANELIKSGKKVTLKNTFYNETFETVLVKNDRYNVWTIDGGKISRDELVIIKVS